MNDSDAETTKPASVDTYLCALPNDKRTAL